jgi:hypothetical protein
MAITAANPDMMTTASQRNIRLKKLFCLRQESWISFCNCVYISSIAVVIFPLVLDFPFD